MPNRLHRPADAPRRRRGVARGAARAAARARLWTARCRTARARVFRPARGMRLSRARATPPRADLVPPRASPTCGGNAQPRALVGASSRARWPRGAAARAARRLPAPATCPCCCCGPTRTALHPLAVAEEALDLLPDGQLRVLAGTGFLMAYDDPVGLARELAAFCG